jgi:deazaflavin-dependent oxidoreductase (nitroreductase family)
MYRPGMSDDNYEPSPNEFIAGHVEQYLNTNGEQGYEMNGAGVIVLTTTGRRTGKVRRTPLIRVPHEDGYLVVASLGGAPEHPVWYLNLLAEPDITIQDRAEVHELRARTATPAEKAALWPIAVEQWPDYANYQASTDRDIPVVICKPR